ncbi:OmpW/AlkL family protein [Roseovarius rhodophyticola]|uniref:OmpW family outer membrane protein n=1 Tax=Roseovarius rhodophyticola TaxID=3080827 RepID=A0ABZ2TIR8_9RHOB|nr:OmpW family outer membrane protein [Roseovarius sp. W115]MDV2931428.1 OmpW family outer membrane protein [Roseovarius sp. W115]
MKHLAALTLATALCGTAAPVLAQSQGDFTLGFGLGYISPDSSDSATAAGAIDVDGDLSFTLTGEYFVSDKIGIELLVSSPFRHDINLVGTGEVAEISHLPPTLSVQYHFTNQSNFTPFVGVGVNYTLFFNEDGVGALAGTDVDLDNSFGIALHAGLDVDVSERSAIRADIRWIDIDTDVSIGGADVGTVHIDPLIFGLSYVWTF